MEIENAPHSPLRNDRPFDYEKDLQGESNADRAISITSTGEPFKQSVDSPSLAVVSTEQKDPYSDFWHLEGESSALSIDSDEALRGELAMEDLWEAAQQIAQRCQVEVDDSPYKKLITKVAESSQAVVALSWRVGFLGQAVGLKSVEAGAFAAYTVGVLGDMLSSYYGKYADNE